MEIKPIWMEGKECMTQLNFHPLSTARLQQIPLSGYYVYRSIVCRAGLTVVSSTLPESHGSMQCVPSKTEPSTWSGTTSSDCRPRTPPGPHQRTTRRHTFSGCSTPKECFVSQIYFVNKNYTQLVFDALMMSGEHNMLLSHRNSIFETTREKRKKHMFFLAPIARKPFKKPSIMCSV